MPRFSQYPFFMLLLLSATQQHPGLTGNEQMVDWNASRPLTWNDYKAPPDPNSDAAASTTTIIGVEYAISPSRFSYKVNCRFSKDHSWGLHKTEYILRHEQGHFDIAEFFARMLHRELGAYEFNSRTYDRDLKIIYDQVMREKENMQNQYDRETNHSINRDNQEEWLEKIRKMLEASAVFAGY